MKLKDDFFEPEVVGDIYVSRALKEVWAINLDLLEVFQQFCENYNLRFFMGFGTLLGAVRHQGFIPWDDDVDILMPRRDFETLKKMGDLFGKPYFLQNSQSEPGFWYGGMMKFRRSDTTCLERYAYRNRQSNHGIGLEIMALDEVPDLPLQQRRQAEQVGRWQRLLWAKSHDEELHSIRGDTEAMEEDEWAQWKRESAIYMRGEMEEKFLNICQQYAMETCQKLTVFQGYKKDDKYRLFERRWFDEAVFMDFCCLRLPAPKGFWQCLRQFYGEGFMGYDLYSKRTPHHPAVWDARTAYTVWQRRILDLYEPEGKKVIVFGTGNMAEKFLEQLSGRLEIVAFVDNNPQTWERDFKGYPVKSPTVLATESGLWHVIIANGYYREIGSQLESMGIRDYYVYVDEWQALFTAPTDSNSKNNNWGRKKYCIAGVLIKDGVLNLNVVRKIRKIKKECQYLIAFCNKGNEDIIGCLQEFRSIDRVVVAELSENAIKKNYYCEIIETV